MNTHQTTGLNTYNINESTALQQLWHFVLHLRWHYQLFILSGGFLLGGFLSTDLELTSFLIQYANVHLLLFGGATAYNSYWDKDTGPIGGLQNPPPMSRWMWLGSLLLQLGGLILALPQGTLYVGVYAGSLLFFWLYSTPMARWKSRPIKSLVAIGLSTGFNVVLLGYLAAGNATLPWPILLAALGVSLMLLSLYPLSQIYQIEEDRRRGDNTFAVQYGKTAVFRFFVIAFGIGLLLVAMAIGYNHLWLAIVFGMIGAITGGVVWFTLRSLGASKEDYQAVMRIKYGTSMAFVVFLVIALILKHAEFLGISGLADWLLK
jgi:4-hydroxybenzoate polyprenyltransferase